VKLAVVRHLPTAWNQAGILQGKRDQSILPPTQDCLKTLSFALCAALNGDVPEVVLASSLKRAQQTAVAFGYSGYEIEPLLDEIDFGLFEGKHRDDLFREYGDTWIQQPGTLELGEPLARFESRIREFLDLYRERSSLLCFGHGAWMRALRSIMLHGDLRAMNVIQIPNHCVLRTSWPQSERIEVALVSLETSRVVV
jgi:probable phosphoglycerate mutase